MWPNILKAINRWNADCYCILRFVCFLLLTRLIVASDSTGVKRIHKDIGPLKLPPSAFTASSVFKNQPDYQAHKANLVVFASQEQSSGAWCPARPVQNQLSEWLQIDFESLKIMRVLFTEGRGTNQNAYVPAFLLRYQRQEGHRWYDYRMRNGTKLLYANHNSQTIAITLDPPIVARRFRLYPYNELEPRLMCLRIAVYGTPFEDGVIEYAIPEGCVYRMDPRIQVSLNDTEYDGSWATLPPDNMDLPTERKAYFYGGLGLLMDKNFYDGQLPEVGDNHNVVGWFRRQHSTPSDRVVIMFTFDQVRNFTQLRIHALNSLDYVAVFRRVSVQFSLGGQYFDRLADPIVLDINRDTYNRRARWVSVQLDQHIGRFVRVTLWFDYDWIVLSEITFDSTVLLDASTLPIEEASDPVRRAADLDLSDTDPWPIPIFWKNSSGPPVGSDRQPLVTTTPIRLADDFRDASNNDVEQKVPAEAAAEGSVRQRMNNTPYLIAVLCCCFGSIAFVILFVFTVYRLRRHRQKRLKKRRNASIIDNKQHQLHLTSNQHNHQFGSFHPSNNVDVMSPDTTFTTILPNSFQYNQLKTPLSGQFAPGNALKNSMDGCMFTMLNSPDPSFAVPLMSPHTLGSVSFSHAPSDTMNSLVYNQFSPGIDQDGLLALQLFQQGSNLNPNFSSAGGATLSHRGGPDVVPCFTSYPFASMPHSSLVNFANSPHGITSNNMPTKLNFCPPPPPDQPLPPLPPPSTSPDSTSLIQSFSDGIQGSLVVSGTFPHPNPYAAACPMTAYPPDANMVLPLDGSMPEYASASLFSGNGSVQPSPGNASFIGSVNGKSSLLDPEMAKYRNISDTYCVPHQNSVHQQYNLWPTGQSYFAPNRLNTTVPNATFSTHQRTASDGQTGSLDSSGMYYLANSCDASQNEATGMIVRDCYNPSQTIFLPFSSGAHLLNAPTMNSAKDNFPHDRFKSFSPDTMDANSVIGHLVSNYHGVLMPSGSLSCAAVNGTDTADSQAESSSETSVRPPTRRNQKVDSTTPA